MLRPGWCQGQVGRSGLQQSGAVAPHRNVYVEDKLGNLQNGKDDQ